MYTTHRSDARRNDTSSDLRRRLRTSVHAYEIATMTPLGGLANRRSFTGTHSAVREQAMALADRVRQADPSRPIPVFRKLSDPTGIWWQAQADAPIQRASP